VKYRDRIKELRRVRAADLKPNAKNWRTHPATQRAALSGVLEEIGYADALLARELSDGSLELIDGHLRAEVTPDMQVPVLVLDVTAEEAEKILLTHDALVKIAGVDDVALGELMANVETHNQALQEMLSHMAGRYGIDLNESVPSKPMVDLDIPASFQVVVECQSEDQQRDVYERMKKEGFPCRVLTL